MPKSRRPIRIATSLGLSLLVCSLAAVSCATRRDAVKQEPGANEATDHITPKRTVDANKPLADGTASTGRLETAGNRPPAPPYPQLAKQHQAMPAIRHVDEKERQDPHFRPRPLEVPAFQFNPFVDTKRDSQSTFSVDVDTASYTMARRELLAGHLPNPDSVRPEEFINFFDYDYTVPSVQPFSINLEAAPSQHGDGKTLFRVGIKGREVPASQRKPANLVFLVDVSGSMQSADKIGLVKYSLKQLVERLQPTDTLGIVVYAGSEAVLLPPHAVCNKSAILDAIDSLEAGGSTNGEAGIRKAYALAEMAKKPGGINRVILCTDGDFNVGAQGQDLIDLIVRFRDRGITLTTLGFGTGNYKDPMMEQLADKGDGNYAYVDSANEALRVLGTKLVSTLEVIAKDVKIQVDFDASRVSRYRLIGYENRDIADKDFTNDAVDAGEIGSGHNVTAYYELEMKPTVAPGAFANVKVRYKAPDGKESSQVAQAFGTRQIRPSFAASSASFRFGAAVAEMAETLRGSPYTVASTFPAMLDVARRALHADSPEEREFLQLAQKAASLWGQRRTTPRPERVDD